MTPDAAPRTRQDLIGRDIALVDVSAPDGVDVAALETEVRAFVAPIHAAETRSLRLERVFQLRGRTYFGWAFEKDHGEGARQAHVAFTVLGSHGRYVAAYSNHDLHDHVGEPGLGLAQYAVWDAHRFEEREALLAPYRERAAAYPRQATPAFELALLVAYANAMMLPGPLDEGVAAAERACRRAPRKAWHHAVRGHLLARMERLDDAAAALQEACAIEPERALFAWHLSQMLAWADDDACIAEERRARRLAKGRRLSYDDFESALVRHAERVRRRVEGWHPQTDAELAEADRAAIRVDPKEVPDDLRDLIPLAERWGVGDDSSRAWLVDHASAREKRQLRAALEGRADRIGAWLDAFNDGPLSDSAAAFLYLMEAVEEMR
jgi:tetratricopeptide (TPR) repeat protein